MIRFAALAILALAAPALAGDDRPEYQMIEAITGCFLGEGDVEKTAAALAPLGWTIVEDSDHGISEFIPSTGEATFIYMSHGVDFCHAESTIIGTTEAIELLSFVERDHATAAITGVDSDPDTGCSLYTLASGVQAVVTSGGNDPVCEDDKSSAVRILFGAGG